jgi:ribosomal protein S15P/S13E
MGSPMALDAEFKKHLHSLMVEVYEQTADEIEQHKRELVFKAQQTHNAAAPPIAYKDAELYRMEFRLSRTIKKYIEAVEIWGYPIDAAFETDMTKEFWSLTAGPNQIQFPPAINGRTHAQAVNHSYAMERQRLAAQLVREGTNRMRELKMKMKAKPLSSNSTIIQGDQYINNGIAGAIGPSSVGTINIQQQWTAIQNEVDLNALTSELEQLRKHFQQSASSSSDYQKLALLSEAEEHAKKHDGSKAMEVLSKVGKGALDVAKDIGTEIAAKVIAKSMGLEP